MSLNLNWFYNTRLIIKPSIKYIYFWKSWNSDKYDRCKMNFRHWYVINILCINRASFKKVIPPKYFPKPVRDIILSRVMKLHWFSFEILLTLDWISSAKSLFLNIIEDFEIFEKQHVFSAASPFHTWVIDFLFPVMYKKKICSKYILKYKK